MNTLIHTPAFPLLIPTDGEPRAVRPENGTDFSLKELYTLLKCETIEIVHSQACGKTGEARQNYILIIDEEGKLLTRNPNPLASEWFSHPSDIINGPAILCHSDYLQ